MNVGEVIAALKDYPEDFDVFIVDSEYGEEEVNVVRESTNNKEGVAIA